MTKSNVALLRQIASEFSGPAKHTHFEGGHRRKADCLAEAADEIEALRARVDGLTEQIIRMCVAADRVMDAIDS